MRTALNIIIGLQLLLGAWWTLPLLKHDGDFSTLYILFIALLANAVFFLVAGWSMWRHPPLRRRAGVVLGLPVLLYGLPWLIKAVAGGPLTASKGLGAILVILAGLLGFCLFFPQRVYRLLPCSLIQSKFLNWLIIIAMIVAWVLPVAGIVWLGSGNSGSSSSGNAVAYAIYYFALYMVLVGAGALVVMTWGWIGLRGDVDNPSRRLHIAQLVIGLPSLVVGLLTMSWLASQQ
jgi:hypothetical protein